MRIGYLIAACLTAGSVPIAAGAQELPARASGFDLLASCRADEPVCGAYLQGALDMMIVARKAECDAPRYDRAALRAAYLRWAERNSYFESVHMTAGAERALSEAWPCRK
jgi:hypothetical protein